MLGRRIRCEFFLLTEACNALRIRHSRSIIWPHQNRPFKKSTAAVGKTTVSKWSPSNSCANSQIRKQRRVLVCRARGSQRAFQVSRIGGMVFEGSASSHSKVSFWPKRSKDKQEEKPARMASGKNEIRGNRVDVEPKDALKMQTPHLITPVRRRIRVYQTLRDGYRAPHRMSSILNDCARISTPVSIFGPKAVRHTSGLRPLVADATKARAVGLRSNCTHNPRLCRALTTWPMTAARHLWGQLSTRRWIAGPARQVMGKRAAYWVNAGS